MRAEMIQVLAHVTIIAIDKCGDSAARNSGIVSASHALDKSNNDSAALATTSVPHYIFK